MNERKKETSKRIAVLFILPFTLWAQIQGQELELRTMSTKANGEKVLKLIHPTSGNIYWVLANDYLHGDRENALSLIVAHRHGVDICNGRLVVTKSRVGFFSDQIPAHNFLFDRSSLKYFAVNPWRSFGKTVYHQISVKSAEKDYNFFPLAEQNTQQIAFLPILSWFNDAIVNFDQAWNKFHREYEKNLIPGEIISSTGRQYNIRESYDKFKDQTVFITSWMQTPAGEVAIGFSSAQKTASKPEAYDFWITQIQENGRLPQYNKSVIFLIDNERVRLEETKLVDINNTPLKWGSSAKAILWTTIPFNVLQSIGNGTTVEFQVGTSEGKLDKEEKEIIKRLLAKSTPLKP